MTIKKWDFEAGHSEAGFKVRHMMVSWVGGFFKNVSGSDKFDDETGELESFETEFDSKSIWTGDENRDNHLKSPDFFDVENHPKITFKSKNIARIGGNQYKIEGTLTIKGISKEVELDSTYLGKWDTIFWEDDKDKGPIPRVGFTAKTKINRHDFGVKWQGKMYDKGGVVVADNVYITIQVEGLILPSS